jgi:disulfide bond formation protein DsbB
LHGGFVYRGADIELVIALIGCEGITRARAELPIKIAGVVAFVLQSFLDVYHHLIGWKIGVGKNGSVINVTDIAGVVSPRRKPVTTIPIPMATPISAADKDHPIVMRSPPPMIVPDATVAGIKRVMIAPSQAASPVSGPIVASNKVAVQRSIARHLACMMTLQATAAAGVQTVPSAMMRVEAVTAALACIETMLPTARLSLVVTSAAPDVSTRPVTTSAASSIAATSLDCIGSLAAALFSAALTTAPFMLVAES